jgi:N-acetylglucosamine kinase-like BadF-type ATPase
MKDPSAQLPIGTLVADAGATKVDRAVGSENGDDFYRTKGFNPFFHGAEDIEKVLLAEGWGQEAVEVDRIFFYGAGCSSKERCRRVEEALRRIYPEARIEVEHDLLGAARAAAGNEAALVGILGTGSNAASYDGKGILEQSGGLGFILGDEGGGAYMGKMLLREYLDGLLPKDLAGGFHERFPRSREEHIEELHRGNDPSRYLASFAPFLKDELDRQPIRHIVRSGFEAYVNRHLLRFDGAEGSVLHTVGSIGHHFRPLLEEVLEENGIRAGRSIEEPIRGLLAYHAAR